MLKYVVPNGFAYYDFNFQIKFPRDQIEFYYDTNHLNGAGARLFSEQFGNLMRAHCRPLPFVRCQPI